MELLRIILTIIFKTFQKAYLHYFMFAVWRCRRSLMAVHFDEVWDDKGCDQMCDTCRNGQGLLFVFFVVACVRHVF